MHFRVAAIAALAAFASVYCVPTQHDGLDSFAVRGTLARSDLNIGEASCLASQKNRDY